LTLDLDLLHSLAKSAGDFQSQLLREEVDEDADDKAQEFVGLAPTS
jgi:hypothetical protein